MAAKDAQDLLAWVALLRGINVGGKHKLPMKNLAAIFEALGCMDVRTFIQSGNVVFRATQELAASIPLSAATAIEAEFGFGVPVVVRSTAELGAVLAGNPFLARGENEDLQHVLFLSDTPKAARLEKLELERFLPDAFAVHGNNIYLHVPGGVAKTKMTNAYFDSRLACICTGRNLRTVRALFELASAL